MSNAASAAAAAAPIPKLILGPSGSGKTSLLGSLSPACLGQEKKSGVLQLRPDNPETASLFRQGRNLIEHGRAPFQGTETLTTYEFSLSRYNTGLKGLLKGRETDYKFIMPDAAGGFVFNSGMSESADTRAIARYRSELLDILKRCDGLIICVDPNNDRGSGEFFVDLPHFLDEANVRRLNISRVLVVLTKADLYVVDQGRNAERHLKRLSPKVVGLEAMTRQTLAALQTYLPKSTRIGFCWSSIYGFLRTGEPNFDKTNQGLLFHPNSADGSIGKGEAIENWRPYQVIEPFHYIATGEVMDGSIIEFV